MDMPRQRPTVFLHERLVRGLVSFQSARYQQSILFARLRGRIVGTAALVRHANDAYELTKIAVATKARRRLVGTKLTLTVVERARLQGARHLYLETHPKLKAAQRLYESIGFKRVDESPISSAYRRRRILMRITL